MGHKVRRRFIVATVTSQRDTVIGVIAHTLDQLSIITKNENPCTFIVTTTLELHELQDLAGVAHVILMKGDVSYT
jgi:hypothetical protein